MQIVNIVLFRKDLRCYDNEAIFNAIKANKQVLFLYIYDDQYIKTLGSMSKILLHKALCSLQEQLKLNNIDLSILKGDPILEIDKLSSIYEIDNIFLNKVYEPYFISLDKKLNTLSQKKYIKIKSYNYQLLIEPDVILNGNNESFQMFTPYWKKCLQHLENKEFGNFSYNLKEISSVFIKDSLSIEQLKLLAKKQWLDNFINYDFSYKKAEEKFYNFFKNNLNGYAINRDYLELDSTSKFSIPLSIGQISIKEIYKTLKDLKTQENKQDVDKFLSELGWREFSYYLLYHNPSIINNNFKKQFNNFKWLDNVNYLNAWQKGKTGVPIIDAAMNELWKTGYMHNRARLIVASFLTKNLLQNWQTGANWFLDTLFDADLANNTIAWQWVAGTGADSAPYFRIFNPVLQAKKFDTNAFYIKKWLPELKNVNINSLHDPWNYPIKNYFKPIIDLNESKKLALSRYQELRS